ncbi:MAG: DUF5683 domain-containing protein [Calditrichia bacterium]
MKFFLPLILTAILSFGFIFSNQAQNLSSSMKQKSETSLDTSRLLSDTPLKSPWGAVLRSAVLPGWGQVYTGHYWKAGLVFSLNAFLLGQVLRNNQRFEDTGNKNFRDRRNEFTWYFAFSYLLTMVDAYVDAYLYKFDEAMRISHQLRYREGEWLAELQLSYHF